MIMSPDLGEAVQLSAAIYFKHLMSAVYDAPESERGRMMSEDTRQLIRDTIVPCLLEASRALRYQLESVLTIVLQVDYPAKLPALADQISAGLSSGDEHRIEGALISVLMLVKNYEYKMRSTEEEFGPIVEHYFPVLHDLFVALLELESAWSLRCQRLVLKCFWCAFQMHMPAYLRNFAVFGSWLEAWMPCLLRPIAPEWDCNAHLAVKKDILEILNRYFHRYGVAELVIDEKDKEFASLFLNEASAPINEALVGMLQRWKAGEFLMSNAMLLQTFNFFESSVRQAISFAPLRPIYDELYRHVLFPLLCVSDDDIEEWQHDPKAYVRRQFSVFQDFISPKTAACNFLIESVKVRPKVSIPVITEQAVELMDAYDADPTNDARAREKSGVLLALSAIVPKLQTLNAYAPQLEQLVVTKILPDMQSPFPYMRMRAGFALGAFNTIAWSSNENYTAALVAVQNAVHDPDLGVSITAALAMQKLLQNPDGLDVIRPILPEVVDAMLNMMLEIDSDDVVEALEALILRFRAELAPLAVPIAANLAELFERIFLAERADMEAGVEIDPQSEKADRGLAALNALRTLNTLLASLKHNIDELVRVEAVLAPLMRRMTLDDSIDFFDHILSMMDTITLYSEHISDFSYEMLGLSLQAFRTWAPDSLKDMLPMIANITRREFAKLLTIADGALFQEMLKIVADVISDVKFAEYDGQFACRLAEIVLLNSSGQIDSLLPQFCELALTRCQSATTHAFRVSLIEVVACCLLNNPVFTINVLAENNVLGHFFDLWQAAEPHCTRFHDLKLYVLAHCKLFTVPVASYDPSFRELMPTLLERMFRMAMTIKGRIDKLDEGRAAMGLNSDEELDSFNEQEIDWGDDDGVDENEDCVDTSKGQYLGYLQDEFERYKRMVAQDENMDFADEGDYMLPIDEFDEFSAIVDTMEALAVSQADVFSALMERMPQDIGDIIEIIKAQAEIEREKSLAEAAKALRLERKLFGLPGQGEDDDDDGGGDDGAEVLDEEAPDEK